jgi:hypothetical protein
LVGTGTRSRLLICQDSGTQLKRILRGDLDHIVAKALEKAPLERYASVKDFSDDLKRYLNNEPVLARADNTCKSEFTMTNALRVRAEVSWPEKATQWRLARRITPPLRTSHIRSIPLTRSCCSRSSFRRLLRQIGEQRQHVGYPGRYVGHGHALVQAMAEPVAVLDENRGYAIARDVLLSEPHAVARAG